MMRDGRRHPNVAVIAPGMPAMRSPTNVAEFTAIGQGVISAIVTRSVNSLIDNQPYFSTASDCISGIAAYPPPKVQELM